MKVLIVDDSGALTAKVAAFLSGWGYAFATATSGLEAVRIARRWRPDAILAQLRLEGMSGLALNSAIRAGADTRHIAALLSGPAEDEYSRRQAQSSGAFAYLPTPLSVWDLQRALARLRNAQTAEVRRRRAG